MTKIGRNGFPDGVVGRFYERETLSYVDVLSVSSQPNPSIHLEQIVGGDARAGVKREFWEKKRVFLEKRTGEELDKKNAWIYHISIYRYSPNQIRRNLEGTTKISDIEFQIAENAQALLDEYVTSFDQVSSIIFSEIGIEINDLLSEDAIKVTDIASYL